jgi:alkylhydroperoxidase/carboxymuconolactone decarboxylase family protein YurZ
LGWISEVKEAVAQLCAYVDLPRSLNALGELLKLVEARKARGASDKPGLELAKPVPTGETLVAAAMTNQAKISRGSVKNAVADFSPTINRFLQAHLFGDIFKRDSLVWQSREQATVGALTATPGVQAQLRSHMAASSAWPLRRHSCGSSAEGAVHHAPVR